MNEKKTIALSKVMSFALRHDPHEFSLDLDEEGWIDLDLLITALAQQKR